MEDMTVNSMEELAGFLESIPDNVMVTVSFGEEEMDGEGK